MLSIDWKRPWNTTWFVVAAIAVLTFLVYANSLKNGFVIWDDDSLITQNPLVQNFSWHSIKGVFTSYDPELYVPFTLFTYQVEHLFVGNSAWLYHFDNLLLHILCTILIFFVMLRLGLNRGSAFMCSLIFALHPINSEAVNWAAARKDVLAGTFFLATLLSYYRYLYSGSKKIFWLSVFFFLCALLSKVVVVLLPFLLLTIDWKEERPFNKDVWIEKIPFFFLSCLFVVIALFGKTQNIRSLTLLQTILLSAKSTFAAIQNFFAPFWLAIIYEQNDPVSIQSADFFIPLLLIVLTILFCVLFWRKMKIVIIALLFFALPLLPTFANFSKGGSLFFFSDRYIYLPQLGLLFLLGTIASFVYEKYKTKIASIITIAVSCALLLLFIPLSYARTIVWGDSETLFRDALTKNDRSAIMHFNLGVVEQKRNDETGAQKDYERAIELEPLNTRAHNNLGYLYYEQKQFDTAIEQYNLALQADPENTEAIDNLGVLALDQGKIDEAIVYFQRAIAINPNFIQAHLNLASAYGKKELYKEGLAEYQRIIEIDPSMRQTLLKNLTTAP